jgi:Zn-dependent protease with chaperone function
MASNFPESFDPVRSPALLAELARPNRRYRRQAWLAMASLVGFMALYAALAGWFVYSGIRMLATAGHGRNDPIGFILGGGALFFAFFMIKSVFFIKRGAIGDAVEVTAAQQPRLFDFLNRLADAAGAPRPHRVFLTSRVNASVFYDLSLLNLIFPSRKNLEIGLGLVNALNFGEFRAVLAHEFGHFAQRAMAIGRWVYVVQQIAGHLIVHRDKLDRALRSLTFSDIRIAWIGWILSMVVWSIRSLVDSAFTIVLLMQRALSREMEFQADLVAVSIAGSDAPIHALYRLQAADDSWDRAVRFAADEHHRGRPPLDVFALQSRIETRMGALRNDPIYGPIPEVPVETAASHRLFTPSFAEPPRMWRTHPLNHEREANAKSRYVAAPLDRRSAWVLFDDAEALRRQLSAALFEKTEAAPAPIEDSLARLDFSFDTEKLKPQYRGLYYSRALARYALVAAELYDPAPVLDAAAFDTLYPPELVEAPERLRNLDKELARLRALQNGALTVEGGALRYRDQTVNRRSLPGLIATVTAERDAARDALLAHDRRCRNLHRAAAAKLGGGWQDYLEGLIAVIHYTEHTEADLRDAQALMRNTLAIETAIRQVGSGGIERILADANKLYWTLEKVYGSAGSLLLDEKLALRSGIQNWPERLGTFKLNSASRANINDWLKVVDGWVNLPASSCSHLHARALDLLLATEAMLAAHLRTETVPEPAPAPSRVPQSYATLLPGAERKGRTKLSPWARFRTGSGTVYGLARGAVALAIIGTVLGAGWSAQLTTLVIHNGLDRTVRVHLDHEVAILSPFASTSRRIAPYGSYSIVVETQEGKQIEATALDVNTVAGALVYNIAGASPLYEWTAIYGPAGERPPNRIGAPTRYPSNAEFLFTEPPKSLSADKNHGTTRLVLSAPGDDAPEVALNVLSGEGDRQHVIAAHARWDTTDGRHTLEWLWLAQQQPGFWPLLQLRLDERPNDVLLRRMEQDSIAVANKPALCTTTAEQSRQAPNDADLAYLALRCQPETPAKEQGFIDAYRRWPQNGWLALGAAYAQAGGAHWQAAVAPFEAALHALPAMRDGIGLEAARVKRMAGSAVLATLAPDSRQLDLALRIEAGNSDLKPPFLKAYSVLANGQITQALDLAKNDQDTAARLLWLAAGSDGADPALVPRALTQQEGIDLGTLWIAAALAARSHKDASPI